MITKMIQKCYFRHSMKLNMQKTKKINDEL